ncbi:hypothetical protein ACTSKR_07830 [Chitinibacteraceae bacterium HSL-7]
MYIVDRAAAVVRPNQPFLEWLNALPGSELKLELEDVRSDCTVLLIPEISEPEDGIAYIDDIFERIFAMELASWIEDESLWPAKRSLQLFWEWFDVEIHLGVLDSVDEDLKNTPTDTDYH